MGLEDALERVDAIADRTFAGWKVPGLAYGLVLDGELRLDCAKIGYVGSTALGMLVALHRRVDDAGGSLVLCNLVPHVRALLRLTRLDTILHIHAD